MSTFTKLNSVEYLYVICIIFHSLVPTGGRCRWAQDRASQRLSSAPRSLELSFGFRTSRGLRSWTILERQKKNFRKITVVFRRLKYEKHYSIVSVLHTNIVPTDRRAQHKIAWPLEQVSSDMRSILIVGQHCRTDGRTAQLIPKANRV